MEKIDARIMDCAIECARQAATRGDVPIGAYILDPDGARIAEGWNTREAKHDPAGHAEINALRAAGIQRKSWNLSGCTLVVTVEPCAMCAGAIVNARISRLIFGAWDPKAGACGSVRDIVRDIRLNHRMEVYGGVDEQRVKAQLHAWFAARR